MAIQDVNHKKIDILIQNAEIIKVCREYMKKTAIPASGDSEYRVNLVSDLLTFTMKESNQLNTEIQRETNPEYQGKLDAKIIAHKNRLASKEGSLGRKLQKEEYRLLQEKKISNYIKETAKNCKNYMRDLKERDVNRIAGITSDEYDAMIAVLEKGSRLDAKTTVAEFTDVLKEMSKVTVRYVETHKGILHGPFSDDGKYRLNAARMFSDYSKQIGRKTEELSIYLPDKNRPISDNIKHREAGINALNQKINEKQGVAPEVNENEAVNNQNIVNNNVKPKML